MKLVFATREEDQIAADAARTASGQGELIAALEQMALARSQRRQHQPKGMDHVFLANYDGTDIVQWHGRKSDGRFYPFGALMRIEGK